MLRRGISRNLDIRVGKAAPIRVVEHLLALRHGFGLYDGVALTVPSAGIPFCGNARIFLDSLRDACEPAAEPPVYTVDKAIGPIRSVRGNGLVAFEPRTDGALVLEIAIDYGHEMYGDYTWDSSRDSFGDIAASRGELKSHLRPAIWLASIFGFKHSHYFADVHAMFSREWIDNLLRHRALDALGALALANPHGRLSGTYRCMRAGHTEDVALVREISESLMRL
jgi:UDP-3-O-acyl-N-acetylglucosamine deacetylase